MSKTLLWEGPVFDKSGYGSCSRSYVSALISHPSIKNGDIGFYVKPVTYEHNFSHDYIDPDVYQKIRSFCANIDESDIHVEHKTPSALSENRGRINVGYTVWETSTLPLGWEMACNKKDMILTASDHSKNILERSGVTVPIEVIPHIIDDNIFKPLEVPRSNKFVVLFCGEFTTRKGADLAVRMFTKAFDGRKDVKMIMKTYVIGTYAQGVSAIKARVTDMQNEVSKRGAPEIAVVDKFFTEQQLAKLYNTADVFLFPSRAEGFGLTVAEAMACGVRVILTDGSGCNHFIGANSSASPVPQPVIVMNGREREILGNELESGRNYYQGSTWMEATIDAGAEALQLCHETSDDQTGDLATAFVHKNYAPEIVVNNLLRSLGCL